MKTHTLPLLAWKVCPGVIAVMAVIAMGQITITGIRGIVRDPHGAVIPKATVRVTDNSTGVEQRHSFFERW